VIALNEHTKTTVEEEDDDDNNNNNSNNTTTTTTTTTTNKKNQPPTWDKEEANARAQSLALLYRYSSPGMEWNNGLSVKPIKKLLISLWHLLAQLGKITLP
jgi:hypothetical protein